MTQLSLIEEPLVVGEHLLAGDVETELQGHQDCKLRGQQVLPVESEDSFRLLYQHLQLVPLAVVQFSRENETCSGAKLPVDFVNYILKNQLLKVDICLRLLLYHKN